MDKDTARILLDKLRDVQNLSINDLNQEQRFLMGKQEGYIIAMQNVRKVIQDFVEEKEWLKIL